MPNGCDWSFELSPLVKKLRVKMRAQRDVIAQCIYSVYKHTPQLPHTHLKYLYTTTRKHASKNENGIRNPTKTHKKLGYRWERRVESGYHILNKRRQRPSRRERGRGKEKKPPTHSRAVHMPPTRPPFQTRERGKHAKLNRSQKESVENQAFSSARILASKSRHTTQTNAIDARSCVANYPAA